MDIDKWVRMSYDSDPKKRLEAARHIAQSDSPFAMFALLELSFDKDEKVRNYVKEVLKQKNEQKSEAHFLLSDLLTQEYDKKIKEEQKEEEKDKIERIKKKLEPIIEEWIEEKDPEKRKMVKKKVMPMVEQIIKRWADKEEYLIKLFGYKKEGKKETKKETEAEDEQDEQETFIEEPEEPEEPVIHNGETKKYLEMISSVERMAQLGIPEISEEGYEEEIGKDEQKEKEEFIEEVQAEEEVEGKDNPFIDPIDRILYNKAIKIVEVPGITKKTIAEQKKQLKKELQLKVDAVFSVAELRAAHRYIEWLNELEVGMKNIYTRDLKVISVEDKVIKPLRGRSKVLKRIVVSDGQNEFPVYLWKGRGKGIYEGETVRLENAEVEMFPVTGEAALVLNKKDSAIIVIK